VRLADQSVGPLADQWERLVLKWESQWVGQSVEMWVLRKAGQWGLTLADQSVGPLVLKWESQWVDQSVEMWVLRKVGQLVELLWVEMWVLVSVMCLELQLDGLLVCALELQKE
jgi:hypothetical protein